MKRALCLLLLLAGCQPGADRAATPKPPAPETAAKPPFADKVWMSTSSPDLPGVTRIFLSEGTVMMDSCWETYRLATWRMTSATGMVLVEDGQEIRADLLAAGEEELVLRLHLVDGTREERYRPASVPFLCPDMPR
jgi:hypothetical protein